MRNALSEHLNVVVSTNIVRRALHEVSLGVFEPFAQRHQDWTIHDWYPMFFLVMGLRSIDFSVMVMLGVR